jgi:hypothetical protein
MFGEQACRGQPAPTFDFEAQRPEQRDQPVRLGDGSEPVCPVDDFPAVDGEADLETLVTAVDPITNHSACGPA